MFKNLKYYYLLVSLPFALLLIGSAVFIDAIASTITRNPHPQINYAIFAIILIGGVFIIVNSRRLVREARILSDFSGSLRAKTDLATLQEMTNSYVGDIACLLQMIAASGGRSISHQEQAALEHELTNARAQLNRRNALPQYLTGLLVGMGLLGTFIGLLATLNDISVLITSFGDLDMKSVDPILVFRTMIDRMKAPMQSMGIAFSASMFGLLGSITLGLMMVGIRRLQGDIVSLLSSEVARHVEIALSYEGMVSTKGESFSGDDYKILTRIEERLAEAARLQQRRLGAEIEDFQKQRSEMLQALASQIESHNNFRGELQQLGRQLGNIFSMLEKSNGMITSQLSDLTVQLTADAREAQKLQTQQVEVQKRLKDAIDTSRVEDRLADAERRQLQALSSERFGQLCDVTLRLAADTRESQQLLSLQLDEQKRLRDALDSYKIEERLLEVTRQQQRTLVTEIEDFQKQRADMLRTLTDQIEASNGFRTELQQLGRQLGSISQVMEKGNDDVRSQISELMLHMSADAKESHKLLSMLVNEQMRLRDSLDLRIKSNN